jgi:hypothetical protein
VRLEELGKFKKIYIYNDHNMNRTRYLPACSIMHQPTTVQRAPLRKGNWYKHYLKGKHQHVNGHVPFETQTKDRLDKRLPLKGQRQVWALLFIWLA